MICSDENPDPEKIFLNRTDPSVFFIKQVHSGEILFVPAEKKHRFENVTDNYHLGFFYGFEGGELKQ